MWVLFQFFIDDQMDQQIEMMPDTYWTTNSTISVTLIQWGNEIRPLLADISQESLSRLRMQGGFRENSGKFGYILQFGFKADLINSTKFKFNLNRKIWFTTFEKRIILKWVLLQTISNIDSSVKEISTLMNDSFARFRKEKDLVTKLYEKAQKTLGWWIEIAGAKKNVQVKTHQKHERHDTS